MSSFSYISFPREADKSCLQSKFDPSKAYKIGDIKGTELANNFNGDLDVLPDSLNVYLGDWTDFHGIQIFDRGDVSFNAVFQNQHIYGFQATFKLLDEDDFLRNSKRIFDESDDPGTSEEEHMAFSHNLIKENRDNVALCRQQLYDLVRLNIYPGEVVEIFTDWVDNRNIFDFGPPKARITLNVEEVLVSELLDLTEQTIIEVRLGKESI